MSLRFLLLFLFLLHVSPAFSSPEPNYFNSLLPSDAVALLSFKSTADLDNKLLYSLTERYDYCQWRGVKCAQGRIVRLVLSGVGLRGYFSSATLTRVDQLRVLSLDNNSLFGPVPDLSPLVNLKSLFLSRNEFTGAFPPSILSLHRLMILSLSYNNLTGQIPYEITALNRLTSLNLEFNRFNGTLPSLNQPFLTSFNVSVNNLTGVIPDTLTRFDASAFRSNGGLCGEIINRACPSRSPFSESNNKNGGDVVISPVVSRKKSKENGLVLGFTVGLASLIVLGVCLVVFSLVMKKTNDGEVYEPSQKGEASSSWQQQQQNQSLRTRAVPISNSNSNEKEEDKLRIPNSGNLIFCGGESSSRSSRAKPLHWTSCLKIAEDVAQGLYYIHQTSSALTCLTDYCLSVLIGSSSSSSSLVSPDDADTSSYKAPEIRKSSRRPTSKCDVYSFGVLIFELLTGKSASRHPFMAPHDMLSWVRAMREEEEGAEDSRLGMMTETACLCRVTSPEQRPTMRQVIKMIQGIKESVMAEEVSNL
ncbi:hypothetical protein Bca52824_060665 [Brassica carinata]|uniref:Serine-threonine/tyrosine-protein kinase catalytic domain-containing protein n=1 Tax=Brassica carinata TaxID=52824 RepID=A0A8X7R0D5_BRACI|nr:hypothetical protein Bca52824_060665 [Brassica carinata]